MTRFVVFFGFLGLVLGSKICGSEPTSRCAACAPKPRAMVLTKLNDDVLIAVLVRLSFTWYGALRTTCKWLGSALSLSRIGGLRKEFGMSETAFLLYVETMAMPTLETPGGSTSSYWTPRVGGGWIEIRGTSVQVPPGVAFNTAVSVGGIVKRSPMHSDEFRGSTCPGFGAVLLCSTPRPRSGSSRGRHLGPAPMLHGCPRR